MTMEGANIQLETIDDAWLTLQDASAMLGVATELGLAGEIW